MLFIVQACTVTFHPDKLIIRYFSLILVFFVYFFFINRYRLYGFGILVLFMHDLGDTLMETAKCFVYFKRRGGKDYKFPDMCANVFFGLFVLNW